MRRSVLVSGVTFVWIGLGILGGCRTSENPTQAAAPPEFPSIRSCSSPVQLQSESIRERLRSEDFTALEQHLQALHAAAMADIACEARLEDAYAVFADASNWLEAPLDHWVAQRPEGSEAHAARGTHLNAVGRARRGPGYIRETPSESLDAMHEAFARAIPDLVRATQLEPTNPVPYTRLIQIAAHEGTDASRDEILARGLAAIPDSYAIRVEYVYYLQPIWGGSIEEMQRFALKEQASIERNPKIRWLLAEPPRAAGLRLLEDGKYKEARPLLEQAVEIRGIYKDHRALLRAYEQLGEHRRVIRTATRCLEMEPNDAWLHIKRAIAYVGIRQNERAIADADRAVEYASEDPAIAYNRAFVIHSAHGQNAAIPAYEKILVIDRNYRPALDKLNGILIEQKRYREAEPLARRVTELFPNDADAWFTYAGVLYCLEDPNAKPAMQRFLELADRQNAEDRKRVEHVENLLATRFGVKPAAPEASGG